MTGGIGPPPRLPTDLDGVSRGAGGSAAGPAEQSARAGVAWATRQQASRPGTGAAGAAHAQLRMTIGAGAALPPRRARAGGRGAGDRPEAPGVEGSSRMTRLMSPSSYTTA